MKKIIGLVGVIAVAVAGYFGGQAMGLFDEKALTAEEIDAVFSTYSNDINTPQEGIRFDDSSWLVLGYYSGSGMLVNGVSTLPADQIPEDYLDSRVAQATDNLCNDETMRAALAGGAVFQYSWKSADGEKLGKAIVGGVTWCADEGY